MLQKFFNLFSPRQVMFVILQWKDNLGFIKKERTRKKEKKKRVKKEKRKKEKKRESKKGKKNILVGEFVPVVLG